MPYNPKRLPAVRAIKHVMEIDGCDKSAAIFQIELWAKENPHVWVRGSNNHFGWNAEIFVDALRKQWPGPAVPTVDVKAKPVMERPIPIASAIEMLAGRLGATYEQAWAEIKSKAFDGRLSLAGIDDKGRPCDLERHWILFIVPWGAEDPTPARSSAPIGAMTPPVRRHPATSDMPRQNSRSMIAFDRERAIRDWRADKREGRAPPSIPPLRMRDVVADEAELDELWTHVEYEFQNLDWSLGNVLSWIAFRNPLLICALETQRDLARAKL